MVFVPAALQDVIHGLLITNDSAPRWLVGLGRIVSIDGGNRVFLGYIDTLLMLLEARMARARVIRARVRSSALGLQRDVRP